MSTVIRKDQAEEGTIGEQPFQRAGKPMSDADPAEWDSPAHPGRRSRRAILEKEAFAIMLEMQREEEQAGVIPAEPWLFLRKCAGFMEVVGAIFLGGMLGSAGVMFSFYVFVRVLHLTF